MAVQDVLLQETMAPTPLLAPEWPISTEEQEASADLPIYYKDKNTPYWPVIPHEEVDDLDLTLAEKAGNLALGSVVAFQLSHANEAARIGAAATVQGLTGSPELAAATFGLTTFIIEGVGTLATAQLLRTSAGERTIDRTNRWLSERGWSRLPRTNLATDMGINYIFGVPAVLILKQREDPSRTFGQNVKYGMKLSAAIAAVETAEAYPVAKGIASTESGVTRGLIVAGALVAVATTAEAIRQQLMQHKALEFGQYQRSRRVAMNGDDPRTEYSLLTFESAVADPRTKFVSVKTPEGKRSWPLLANASFRYDQPETEQSQNVYYLSLPPDQLLDGKKVERQIAQRLHQAMCEGATIFFDQDPHGRDIRAYLRYLTNRYYPKDSGVLEFGDATAEQVSQPVNMLERLLSDAPRYDLSAEEVRALEGYIVEETERRHPEPGVYAALIPSHRGLANLVRHYEQAHFPEVQNVSSDVEDDTMFVALVDTRPEVRRVVHALTITGLEQASGMRPARARSQDSKTGFASIDDLIEMGNFTAEEFRDYYAKQGIDLEQCIAVETNFRVGERAPRYNGLDISALAYMKVFDLFMRGNPQLERAAVFANINRASRVSFGRFGLVYNPLMGRTDLRTSDALRGLDYEPVIIHYDSNAQALFAGLNSITPEIEF